MSDLIPQRDSYLIADSFEILPTIPSETFDLILTDPPYGMNYKSNRAKTAKGIARNQPIKNDDSLAWMEDFLYEAHRILKPNRHCYVFTTWSTYPELYYIVKDSRFELKGVIVWNKTHHGSGDLNGGLAPCHEWILFLTKGRRLWHKENPESEFKRMIHAQKGRPYDIVEFPPLSNAERDHLGHPTPKPPDLLRWLIENSTLPGEFIIDPFAGSFRSAVACKKRRPLSGDHAERHYFCIEKDPQYEHLIKSALATPLFEPGLGI